MREPKKNEIVRLKSDEKEYKVLDYCLGLVSLRENIKHSRNKIEASLDCIEFTEPEKKKPKKPAASPVGVSITNKERGQILKDLIYEQSLKENFMREIVLLARLIRRFPHRDFWLEGFKPAIRANSLLYWMDRGEVEMLYKKWAIDLSSKREEIVLEKEKIGEDIILPKKRARNLLELLT